MTTYARRMLLRAYLFVKYLAVSINKVYHPQQLTHFQGYPLGIYLYFSACPLPVYLFIFLQKHLANIFASIEGQPF